MVDGGMVCLEGNRARLYIKLSLVAQPYFSSLLLDLSALCRNLKPVDLSSSPHANGIRYIALPGVPSVPIILIAENGFKEI